MTPPHILLLLVQREAAERLAEVERKHLQAQLSYEEAIIARECHVRNIQHKAKAVKEEVTLCSQSIDPIPMPHSPILQSESLMQAYFAQREEQHKELRRLVEMTIASHHNTKEARSQLQAMKRSIGKVQVKGSTLREGGENVCDCIQCKRCQLRARP